jgi:general secretion pathway protein A
MMYQTYYGLDENPFRINTDTKFVYWSQTHQGAYRHLLYSVQSDKNLIVLSGAVGTGKTTLLHVLMEWVKTAEPTTRLAYVVHSTLTVTELLHYIAHELGLDCQAQSKVEYVLALQRLSRQCAEHGERLLLILDEAQNYSHDVLEEVRLLSNIETPQDKQLQIILAGQPQLINNINQQDVYQLKQRVNVTYNLMPLNYGETQAYIQKRLDVAGAQGRALFHEDAIDAIYQYSQGLPRVINVMCDHALLYAFSADKRQVSEKNVREVAADMGLQRGARPQQASPAASVYSDEAAGEADYQADHIIAGYTKNSAGQGGTTQSPSHELFSPPDDWRENWEDAEKSNRRRSLLQFAGIVIFIIFVVIGIFFVQIPSLKKESSATNSAVMSKSATNSGQRQVSPYIPIDKGIMTPPTDKGIVHIPKEPSYADQNHQKIAKEGRTDTAPSTNEVPKKNTDEGEHKYVTVRNGDTFEKVLLKAYGQYDNTLIALVLEANPDIANINTIFVGQRIRLPKP